MSLVPVFGALKTADHALGTYRAHGDNNYRDQPCDDHRLGQYMQRFEANCRALSDLLAQRGIPADDKRWKQHNFNYLWPQRILLAKGDIESLVPLGASYVLVNNNELENNQLLAGRRCYPFLECNGEYWGPPRNDDVAIAELSRLRSEKGAAYVFFSWTAYWWLEHYVKFHAWLCAKHRCILQNERLIGFYIRDTDES
jgi:hypothetical protein